ncbi:MAG: hypothetical protein ABR548_04330, partial [Actinomycetota bacterium]
SANSVTMSGTTVVGSSGGMLNMYSASTTQNLAGSDVYSANIQWTTCGISLCDSWYAQSNTLPSSTLQMDPLGNSATAQFTITDQSNVAHTLNLTISRPQSTWAYNSLPNPWVDTNDTAVFAGAPYVAFSRTGYTITGTIDNVSLVNNPQYPCPNLCGSTWGSLAQTLDNNSVYAN